MGMFLTFSLINIDITNVDEVFLHKDKHDNFYSILNDFLKFAPENFYVIRELYKKLNEDISLENAHTIYKEHIKDDNYILSPNDYESIIECILTNYSDSFIVSNKLLDVSAKCIVAYLIKHQTKDVFLSFIRTFINSELLEIKQIVDEMLVYTGDDFYKKVCYVENENSKYPSPTHFIAYEREKDVN